MRCLREPAGVHRPDVMNGTGTVHLRLVPEIPARSFKHAYLPSSNPAQVRGLLRSEARRLLPYLVWVNHGLYVSWPPRRTPDRARRLFVNGRLYDLRPSATCLGQGRQESVNEIKCKLAAALGFMFLRVAENPVGHARVSTADQDPALQHDALNNGTQ